MGNNEMTQSLEEFQDVANKSVTKILENTEADSVAIIVCKDGESLISSRVINPLGALGLVDSAKELQKDIATKAIAQLSSVECQCDKCVAKRAANTTVH